MRRLSLVCLIVLLLGPAMAFADQHIYQWTDANGTTHYSDSPPPDGVKYKNMQAIADSVSPASASSSAKVAATAAATGPATPTSAAKPKRVEDTPDNRKKMCTKLSSNMQLLQGSAPVLIGDTKGQQQSLSKDQRAKALAKTQVQYDQYCK